MAKEAGSLERFQREARAASALNHPGICTVYEIDQHEGQHFIAMELLEGETLADRIRRGPFEVAPAAGARDPDRGRARVGARQGHRAPRLEARQHLRRSRGQAKILDFGLAKIERARTAEGEHSEAPTAVQPNELTSAGTTLGTVSYMSPEQARGQVTDARTDLFSLGTVLYQTATGALPFQGETSAVVFDAILNREPPPLAQVNPALPAELGAILGGRSRRTAICATRPPPTSRPSCCASSATPTRAAGARPSSTTRDPVPPRRRPRSPSRCSTSRTSPG